MKIISFIFSVSLLVLLTGSFGLVQLPHAFADQPYKPGEVLVKMKGIASAESDEDGEGSLGTLAARLGVDKAVKLRSRHVVPGLYALKLKSGASVPDTVAALSHNPDVEYAQPNYVYHATRTPNDARFGELWGLSNTGQYVNGVRGIFGSDIDAPGAWSITTGSPDVVVGVIDTGVDYNHPDLAANIWTNPDEIPGNGVDDDGDGYIDDVHGINAISDDPRYIRPGDPNDDEGHGTHVSGTIGAVGDNGIGVTGVNWTTRIMGLKFLSSSGGGYDSDAVACIDYAVMMKQRGVNVRALNASWGGPGGSPALKEAISRAGQAGILFVAAAGNDALDNDTHQSTPATFNLPNLIAVAATDGMDRLAWFSNYGRNSVHVAAPGVDILSTVPLFPGHGYAFMDGTSMATPHVTGLAALILSAMPELGTQELKNLIMSSVDPIPGLPVISGGRVNAARALDSKLTLNVRQDGRYTIMTATPRYGGSGELMQRVTFYQDGVAVGRKATGRSGSENAGVAVIRFKATLGDGHQGTASTDGERGATALRSAPVAYDTRPPAIAQVSSPDGTPGSTVTVTGTNFGSKKGRIKLTDGVSAFYVKTTAWSDQGGLSTASFVVPNKAPKTYGLTVANPLAESAPVSFTIDAAP